MISTWGLIALGMGLALVFPRGIQACPGPVSLGTDLSILTHNDLYGTSFHLLGRQGACMLILLYTSGVNSTRDQSVIIASKPVTSSAASDLCHQLGESLWTPQIDDFLPYLAFQNNNQSQVYWAEGGCVNITVKGYEMAQTACGKDEEHAVICSNSAPRATSTNVDNSTYWGVEVDTNGHFVTG